MYDNYIPVNLQVRYTIENPTFNDLFSVEHLKLAFGVNHAAQIRGVAKERLAHKFIWQKIVANGRIGFIRRHCKTTALILDCVEGGVLAPVKVVDAWQYQNRFLSSSVGEEFMLAAPALPRLTRLVAIEDSIRKYPDLPINEYLTVTQARTILQCARETVYKLSTLRGLDLEGKERPLKTVEYEGRSFWLPESVYEFAASDRTHDYSARRPRQSVDERVVIIEV